MTFPIDSRLSAKLRLASGRITQRDRYVCRLLSEHRVLTTDQICNAAFNSTITTSHRLQILHQLDVVEKFRTQVDGRVSPLHFVLGEVGACVIAAEKGGDAVTGWQRNHSLAIAKSSHLSHLVGVNGFFTALLRAQRIDKTGTLTKWWSERRCVAEWGEVVRPDGFGVWQDDAELQFFVEYDRGTESLGRVAAKVDRYRKLLEKIGPTAPVLFVFESVSRERSFRKLIGTPVGIVVATTSSASCPAEQVWQPYAKAAARMDLSDLARWIVSGRETGE
jgi:hypothetical protein